MNWYWFIGAKFKFCWQICKFIGSRCEVSHDRDCSSSSGTGRSASCAGDAFPGAPVSRGRPDPRRGCEPMGFINKVDYLTFQNSFLRCSDEEVSDAFTCSCIRSLSWVIFSVSSGWLLMYSLSKNAWATRSIKTFDDL